MVAKHAKNLVESGFLQVPYQSSLRNHVLKTVTSWKNFCDLSRTDKNALCLPSDGATETFGYQGSHITQQPKEIFEATSESINALMGIAQKQDADVVKDFTENILNLLSVIEKPVLEFAQLMEEHFGLAGFSDEVLDNRKHWTLKLNHQFKGRHPVKTFDEVHSAESVFALYLHENLPGFQYQHDDMHWKNLPMNDDSLIIIPSPQLTLRSKGKIATLPTQVISNTAIEAMGRFSMVLSVHVHKS